MATFTKFNCLTEDLWLGKHVIGTHTFKVMLTNVAPSLFNTVKSDITEITPGNGYPAGGATATVTQTRSGVVAKQFIADMTFTASGGSMAAFRYAVVYNASTSGNPLWGYIDHGSSVTKASGEYHTFNFSEVDGTTQTI